MESTDCNSMNLFVGKSLVVPAILLSVKCMENGTQYVAVCLLFVKSRSHSVLLDLSSQVLAILGDFSSQTVRQVWKYY